MKRVLSFAAAALLFAAACGGADDEGEPTPPPPASATLVAGTATPAPAGEELLYTRDDNSIWLYDVAARRERQLVDAATCPDGWSSARWNDAGTVFALTCGQTLDQDLLFFDADGSQRDRLDGYALLDWAGDTALVALHDPADPEDPERYAFYDTAAPGIPPAPAPDVGIGMLSPDGNALAFYRPLSAPCAPECPTGLVLHDTVTSSEASFGDATPRLWLQGGRTLIVREGAPDAPDVIDLPSALLDIASGQQASAPYLDGLFQLAPSARDDAVIGIGFEGQLGLVIVDLSSGERHPVVGSTISYPSDHIPEQHIASTPDHVYWFNATGQQSPWFRAAYDGTGLEELGAVESYFADFSPGVTHVAYVPLTASDADQYVAVATIDASTEILLPPSGFPVAWRPHP